MKKAVILVSLAVLFLFIFIFASGLALGGLINQAKADEIMPYSVIEQNDSFQLTIKTDQDGKATSLSYGYEFAD